jgi:hypothetical protein
MSGNDAPHAAARNNILSTSPLLMGLYWVDERQLPVGSIADIAAELQAAERQLH